MKRQDLKPIFKKHTWMIPTWCFINLLFFPIMMPLYFCFSPQLSGLREDVLTFIKEFFIEIWEGMTFWNYED